MAIQTAAPYDALVRDDTVHRRIYTDPDIYRDEMARIYGRTWVFIAHESEVPEPGDFKTDTIGGRPIIIARDSGGQVHILNNACRHRGATVCNLPDGNTTFFRCPYHAWTYKTDGTLAL